jgi:subtilisin family serine protease
MPAGGTHWFSCKKTKLSKNLRRVLNMPLKSKSEDLKSQCRMLGRIIFLFSIIISISPTHVAAATDQIVEDPAGYIMSLPETEQDPKLSSQVSNIIDDVESGASHIRGIVSGNESNQTVKVDIFVNLSLLNETALMPYLKEIRVRHRNLIEADAYVNSIPDIRGLSFVNYIDIPVELKSYGSLIDPAYLLSMLDIPGPPNGGDGIIVAVLDKEFYADDIINTSLPRNIVLEKEHDGYKRNEVHGAACSEVIGQIAPNVKLYQIYAGGSPMEMLYSGIRTLEKLGEKVDIVSCSMGINRGPGLFGIKDDLYYAVNNLTSQGIIWVNAAGNEAEKHWMGNFSDPDGNGFNNFSDIDESINVTLERGDHLQVYLSWNDWKDPFYGRSTQDYDLYVLGPSRAGGPLREKSLQHQRGRDYEFPEEAVGLFANKDGIYQILIKKKNATDSNTSFHLFIDSTNSYVRLDEHRVPEDSLCVLARYENVVAVGALNTSENKIAPYSSQGGAINEYIKPDIVAPTNLKTLSYYPRLFDGTSAATPVVAGCLALAIEKSNAQELNNPQDAIKRIMGHCKDLGLNGPDCIYGNGLIKLDFLYNK